MCFQTFVSKKQKTKKQTHTTDAEQKVRSSKNLSTKSLVQKVEMEVEKVREVQPLLSLLSPLPWPKPNLPSPRHGVSIPSHLSGLTSLASVASDSNPKPHHDLGDRSSEDVSTRNFIIMPT